jgi:hypothetical protein
MTKATGPEYVSKHARAALENWLHTVLRRMDILLGHVNVPHYLLRVDVRAFRLDIVPGCNG